MKPVVISPELSQMCMNIHQKNCCLFIALNSLIYSYETLVSQRSTAGVRMLIFSLAIFSHNVLCLMNSPFIVIIVTL